LVDGFWLIVDRFHADVSCDMFNLKKLETWQKAGAFAAKVSCPSLIFSDFTLSPKNKAGC